MFQHFFYECIILEVIAKKLHVASFCSPEERDDFEEFREYLKQYLRDTKFALNVQFDRVKKTKKPVLIVTIRHFSYYWLLFQGMKKITKVRTSF